MAWKPTTIPGTGVLVAGAYRLDGILLRGERYMIVAATHIEMRMRVVLELAWPPRIESTTVQRFLRDARAASEVRSPHLARVLDAGALDDGGFYVATEYVEGDELRTELAHRGSLAPHEAAIAVIQACDAVGRLHAAHVVHRDVELSNLRVTRGGIKVVGHARLTSLLRAPNADARSDIFGLGRILFELVTGQSPLVAGVALLRERTHLPRGFVGIIERCLALDAAYRYQLAGDLAAALGVFTAQQHVREAPRFTTADLVAVEADLAR
ncbi:MAG: protein kinase [Myxococcota bacterium]|nr:protein kinase [Myxococcota bacterium]